MMGIDINTIRELMGHKSIAMTLRYSHLSPNHKSQAVGQLGKLLEATQESKVSVIKKKDEKVSALK